MTDADLLRRILGAMRPDIPMDWHDQAWLAAKGLDTLEAIERAATTPAPLDVERLSYWQIGLPFTREGQLEHSRQHRTEASDHTLIGKCPVAARVIAVERAAYASLWNRPGVDADALAATPAPLDEVVAALVMKKLPMVEPVGDRKTNAINSQRASWNAAIDFALDALDAPIAAAYAEEAT